MLCQIWRSSLALLTCGMYLSLVIAMWRYTILRDSCVSDAWRLVREPAKHKIETLGDRIEHSFSLFDKICLKYENTKHCFCISCNTLHGNASNIHKERKRRHQDGKPWRNILCSSSGGTTSGRLIFRWDHMYDLCDLL